MGRVEGRKKCDFVEKISSDSLLEVVTHVIDLSLCPSSVVMQEEQGNEEDKSQQAEARAQEFSMFQAQDGRSFSKSQ